MSSKRELSRRDFIRVAGLAAAGTALAACGAPDLTPESGTPTQAAGAAPTVITPRKVRIAAGGWAEQNTKDLLAKPLFTEFLNQTGIEVEVVLRTDTKETELTRLASAVQSGTSPYDIIDFEDELTTSFSQAGYMVPLNDLLPAGFWDDFPASMKAYSDVWSTHNGEVFRVIHNWEMPYWFYRKDWFSEEKVQVGLPPIGPGGAGNSTYAASWGFGIVKTSPNLEAARELFTFLVSNEVAAEAARTGFWYVSARNSVLDAVGDQGGLVDLMKMYTEADVIGVRPHHPQYVEALTIVEDTAAAYLTDQVSLDESLQQARDRMGSL